MSKKSNYVATFSRKQCHKLAQLCMSAPDLVTAARILELAAHRVGRTTRRQTWGYFFARYAKAWREGRIAGDVFAQSGNTKLPFVSFSSLAIYSCPVAGDCKRYCYSLRAWRYPAAFLRQLQNSLFMKHAPQVIAEAWGKIKFGRSVRLYVDGDFASVGQVAFWADLMRSRPDLQVYGYTKSWHEVLAYTSENSLPANYVINLSSGSIHDDDTKQRMASLPNTRGEFIAVKLDNEYSRSVSVRFADSQYHAEVREKTREATGQKRVFSCTGKCGACANFAHACGDNVRFAGVPIAIGIH